MSGNREALKVTSRMLGGGSDPGTDVTSRNELTDGPTHRDPPEGISKKLEGRVGFQMAQKQGGVCSDHALLTTFGGNVKPTCRGVWRCWFGRQGSTNGFHQGPAKGC